MYERIVCLTEEPTEILYRLEEDRRIVGISGFTVRPARARKEKPKVSAFTSAKIDRILALDPDLVFGFSDIQADIAADLIRSGVEVHIFNHRSVAEILRTVRAIAGLVGCPEKGERLAGRTAGGSGPGGRTCGRAVGGCGAAPTRLLRGVVRPADLGDPLGIGADRAGGRRGLLSGVPRVRAGEGSDHRGPRRGRAARARRDYRLVVRAQIPARKGGGARGVGCHSGRGGGTHPRDQVGADPAAGSGRAHGRAGGVGGDHRGVAG